MDLNDLAPELKEKAKACKTPDELLALAEEEGYELSEAELDEVAGGRGKWAHEECEDFVRQGKPRKK